MEAIRQCFRVLVQINSLSNTANKQCLTMIKMHINSGLTKQEKVHLQRVAGENRLKLD